MREILNLGSYDLGLRTNSTQKQQMKDRRQSQSFQAQLLFEKSEDNAYSHKVKSAKGTKILEKVLYLYKSLSHTNVSCIHLINFHLHGLE